MLMPKKDRVLVCEYLFKNGVCVAKKDFNLAKHPEIEVPNLHVIKAVQSLVSRGFVKEQFAWRHYYWTLTNEGIAYLRDFLHLPPEIVPSTLKRQQRPETGARTAPGRFDRGGYDKEGVDQDRQQYKRSEGRYDKSGEAGVGAGTMEFRGGSGGGFGGGFGNQGFGRGKPPQ